MEQTQQFLNFLQSCITPVALVSGIGLLLLTLTNRLGRTIDRTRNLVAELDNKATKKRNQKEMEIRILYRRSKLLKNSIGSIVISIMSSSLKSVMILFHLNLILCEYVSTVRYPVGIEFENPDLVFNTDHPLVQLMPIFSEHCSYAIKGISDFQLRIKS
jgi:hypothetical protein